MAAGDRWRVVLRGRGGHGAQPQLTADPIAAAGQLVTALQTIVSRNVGPLEAAVVSVCSIHGGTAFNIIPPELELVGTTRSFTPEVRTLLQERLRELCAHLGAAMGVEATVTFDMVTPAVVNEPAATALLGEAAGAVLGPENIAGGPVTMGSEDMAYFLNEVPGAFLFLGSASPEGGCDLPHHHPGFRIDERALPLGVAILVEAVRQFLR
jgi:amidohydrolase